MNVTHDQASDLRTLVRQSRRNDSASLDSARTVLVASGKTRAGSTTVAIQLAIAAARGGQRVNLVDMDSQGGDVAQRMQLSGELSIGDVLYEQFDPSRVLVEAAEGVQVVPGTTGPMAHINGFAIERFKHDYQLLTRHCDLVVIDGGSRVESLQRVFWHLADAVLMVSSSDRLSVLDSYAALKTNHVWDLSDVGVFVNQAPDGEIAKDVHGRIRRACRRFLKTDIAWRGWLPYSSGLAGRSGNHFPAPASDLIVSATFETLALTYSGSRGERGEIQSVERNSVTSS